MCCVISHVLIFLYIYGWGPLDVLCFHEYGAPHEGVHFPLVVASFHTVHTLLPAIFPIFSYLLFPTVLPSVPAVFTAEDFSKSLSGELWR